jgi:hypothetical protein
MTVAKLTLAGKIERETDDPAAIGIEDGVLPRGVGRNQSEPRTPGYLLFLEQPTAVQL